MSVATIASEETPATRAFPPPALKIGPLVVDPPILQAPMAGYTNYAFRQMVRTYGGVGLLATEMVNANSFMWMDRIHREHPDLERLTIGRPTDKNSPPFPPLLKGGELTSLRSVELRTACRYLQCVMSSITHPAVPPLLSSRY